MVKYVFIKVLKYNNENYTFIKIFVNNKALSQCMKKIFNINFKIFIFVL